MRHLRSYNHNARFYTDRGPSPDDRVGAYQRLVDRLLGSEHFGEKQAMHCLDQVRYADSDGHAKDYTRPHTWRYWCWVVDALNSGMPFDRFSIEQIAGRNARAAGCDWISPEHSEEP